MAAGTTLRGRHFPVKGVRTLPLPERLWSLLPFITQTTSTTALGFNTTRLTKAAHNGRGRGKAGTTWGHSDLLAHAMGRKGHNWSSVI